MSNALTIGSGYNQLLEGVARHVEHKGVAATAASIRERKPVLLVGREVVDLPLGAVPPAAEKAPPSLASRLNVIKSVRSYFAEQKERATVARGLRDVGLAQKALTDHSAAAPINLALALRVLRRGHDALRGTELADLFPGAYVDALHERFCARIAAPAAQAAERLVGQGNLGLLMEKDSGNFVTELEDMRQGVECFSGAAQDRLAGALGDAVAALGAILRSDRTVDLEQLEKARQGVATAAGEELKGMLSGRDRTVLFACIACLVELRTFGETYPDRPVPPADVAAARRFVMWNTRITG